MFLIINRLKGRIPVSYTHLDVYKRQVRYQAREQVALEKFLKDGNFCAVTTNFEDLQQLRQLPGLACQDIMRKGYGFGGEGDWKVAAMTLSLIHI